MSIKASYKTALGKQAKQHFFTSHVRDLAKKQIFHFPKAVNNNRRENSVPFFPFSSWLPHKASMLQVTAQLEKRDSPFFETSRFLADNKRVYYNDALLIRIVPSL